MSDQANDSDDDYKSIDSGVGTNENENQEVYAQRGRTVYRPPGGCIDSGRYGHSFLTCSKCNIGEAKNCFVFGCPCNGKGKMFLLNDDTRLYAHEIPDMNKSVRIYANRPKRSCDRVKKSIAKFERIQRRTSSTGHSSQENMKENNEKLKDPDIGTAEITQSSLMMDGQNEDVTLSASVTGSVSAANIQGYGSDSYNPNASFSPYSYNYDEEGNVITHDDNDDEYAILLSSNERDTENSTKKTKEDN